MAVLIGRRSARLLCAALLVLFVAALPAVAGCGSSSVVSGAGDVGNAVPPHDFVGDWTSPDVMIDGTWNGSTGTFTLTPGSLGGGIAIAQSGGGLTATLVGNSGTQTTAFPATVTVDTLSFSVPDASGGSVVWDVQIPDPATGKALLQVGADSSTTWDLEQVSPIPTGS